MPTTLTLTICAPVPPQMLGIAATCTTASIPAHAARTAAGSVMSAIVCGTSSGQRFWSRPDTLQLPCSSRTTWRPRRPPEPVTSTFSNFMFRSFSVVASNRGSAAYSR